MAEIRIRNTDELSDVDSHGHRLPHGTEVLVFYRDGCINNGRTRWNELPLFGCICPWDDVDPECPYPVLGGDYYED